MKTLIISLFVFVMGVILIGLKPNSLDVEAAFGDQRYRRYREKYAGNLRDPLLDRYRQLCVSCDEGAGQVPVSKVNIVSETE